mgnify:CR=1 FL=1
MTDGMTGTMSETQQTAATVLREVFDAHELEWKEISPGMFTVVLPGEKKLQTPCRFDVGEHALGVHAFVARRPDENHERVYRWLLERNLKLYGVSFALDHMGDIYLDGRLPLDVVKPTEVHAVWRQQLELPGRAEALVEAVRSQFAAARC